MLAKSIAAAALAILILSGAAFAADTTGAAAYDRNTAATPAAKTYARVHAKPKPGAGSGAELSMIGLQNIVGQRANTLNLTKRIFGAPPCKECINNLR